MNGATTFRETSKGGKVMRATTRLRKRAAIVVMAAAIALGTTACFPDVSSSGPTDPYISALYQAMNQDRANNGLPPLSHSPKLENLAGTWAWQMASANSLYHQDLAGVLNTPDFQAFHTLGENIIVAPGSYTPQQLEAAWMASAPHRANILSGAFNVVGLGRFVGPDGRLWAAADFGGI
jgi:uncharacterized protein YkwD